MSTQKKRAEESIVISGMYFDAFMGENSVAMRQHEEKKNLQMAELKVVMTNPELHIQDDIPLALEDQARVPLNKDELSGNALRFHRVDESLKSRPWRQPEKAIRGLDGRYYPNGIRHKGIDKKFFTPASSKLSEIEEPEVSTVNTYGISGLRRGFLTRKICFQWQSNGQCSYGNRCRFSHEIPEDEALSQKYDDLFSEPDDLFRQEMKDASLEKVDKSWVN